MIYLELEDYIDDLSSNDPIDIISGLDGVSYYVKSKHKCPPDLPNHLFHVLIPFLNHNHYKIRSMSIAITEYLFMDYFHDLTDTIISLPLLLFSLASVNQNIVKSATFCLRILLDMVDVSKWWPEVEDCVLHSKSKSVRVTLLTILSTMVNRIPIESIVYLLNDPLVEIQKLTEQILLNSDEDRVKKALLAAHLPINVNRKFMIQFMQNMMAKQRLQEEERLRKLEREEEQRRKEQEQERELQLLKESQKKEHDEEQNNDDDLSFPRLTLKMMLPEVQFDVYNPAKEEKTKEDSIIEKPKSVKQETKIREKQVGKITEKTSVKLPVQLRDMSQMSWLERVTFLEMLHETLKLNRPLNMSSTEVVQCALTAAFPLHKKTTPLLAQILAELIYLFPEALQTCLNEITKFLLHAIRSPPILNNDNGLPELLEALLSEASPSDLIDSAVFVATENPRPLQIEQYILLIYKKRPDTALPKATTKNLLCMLIHSKTPNKYKDKLLSVLCEKEINEVKRFYQTQEREAQMILRKWMPKDYFSSKTSRKNSTTNVAAIKKMSQREITVIVEREIAKGAKSDYPKFVMAMRDLKIDDIDHLVRLFSCYLVYLSKWPPEKLKANESLIFALSEDVFNTPKLLSVLDAQYVSPSIIRGLCIYVWHCPKSILINASCYYPILYELFAESHSTERKEIAKIALAIEKATGKSLLDLGTISHQHRTILMKLQAQYDFETV